ncbi:MAG TPA: trypsin-like peptidase domain-containing protein [Pyrinomonadaceae bacterium]|nr:trypsin-like peptidase domain-containing protein [Pyrinomonadaceae bacterium]
MERIVLKHLSGSKANQVEEFPLNHVKELVLGRDPSSTVKYDPDRDDLVGRQHARITQDPSDPTQFIVTDLNSRNGTFVNRQKLSGTSRLNFGDVVQLGPGGPEFVFEYEPRPATVAKTTRVASTGPMAPTVSGAPATRVPDAGPSQPPFVPPTAAPSSAPGGVGKATVERIVAQNVAQAKKSQGRTFLVVGSIAAVLLILVVGGIGGLLYWRARTASSTEVSGLKQTLDAATAGKGMSPTEIASQAGNAVVKIDVAWRLVSPEGDGNVYHQLYKDQKSGREIALYFEFPDGTVEPALTYSYNPNSYAIGGRHSGSGFSVSNDGFILTNRHVAAAWETTFTFPDRAYPGIVINRSTGQIRLMDQGQLARINWVPARTKQTNIKFEGRNDSLYVTFPKQDSRIIAKLNRVSPRHDVALIKIDMPGTVPKVDINDNYDSIKQGDDVVVLGYPGVSPPITGIVKSQDIFNRETQNVEIPDPTFSKGNIGRVLRGEEKSGGVGDKDKFSHIGDAYQLTINSTGAGNSGGPVVDEQGKVIGIFYAGTRGMDATITFAVPIRYGRELMGVN